MFYLFAFGVFMNSFSMLGTGSWQVWKNQNIGGII